jgi:hypothetical protein
MMQLQQQPRKLKLKWFLVARYWLRLTAPQTRLVAADDGIS